MSDRATQVGFSQRVRLEWLELTASLVLAGNDREAIVAALQDRLMDKVSVGGTAERGNREKIITILLKVWFSCPPELENLRTSGLALLARSPKDERLALHWGMVMAVYPFWAEVATQVGRLLRLQGTAAATHVQRRVREQYGERETVSRAARRVLRSMMDWAVLEETGTKGVYQGRAPITLSDPAAVAFMVECALRGRSSISASLRELMDSPSLYPFQLATISGDFLVKESKGLEIVRHGLDEEMVMVGG